jgi:hypothetical protein
MSADSKVNYTSRPIPSSPGAQQITSDALKSKKGSAPMNSTLPKDYVIPGPSSSSKK